MRRAALALVAVLAACTFPDVDYADDGGAVECHAPTDCASDATSCAALEENKHKACINACKPSNPSCPGQCDQDHAAALSSCAAICESCASATCGSKTTDCSVLVGL